MQRRVDVSVTFSEIRRPTCAYHVQILTKALTPGYYLRNSVCQPQTFVASVPPIPVYDPRSGRSFDPGFSRDHFFLPCTKSSSWACDHMPSISDSKTVYFSFFIASTQRYILTSALPSVRSGRKEIVLYHLIILMANQRCAKGRITFPPFLSPRFLYQIGAPYRTMDLNTDKLCRIIPHSTKL